jgi:hypothetical protein
MADDTVAQVLAHCAGWLTRAELIPTGNWSASTLPTALASLSRVSELALTLNVPLLADVARGGKMDQLGAVSWRALHTRSRAHTTPHVSSPGRRWRAWLV